MTIPKEIYRLFPSLDCSCFFLQTEHPRSSAELPYGITEECHLLNHSTSSVFEVVLFQNFGSDENWVVPLLSNSNSHHQGFCIFRRGSRTSPSFVTTVHGSGIPNNHLDLEYV